MISAYILYDGTAHSYLHAHAHTHYNNWIKLKKIFWIIVFLWWPKFISEYQRNRKAPVWRGSNFFFWKVDCILCYSITSILSPSENASIKLKLHAYKKKITKQSPNSENTYNTLILQTHIFLQSQKSESVSRSNELVHFSEVSHSEPLIGVLPISMPGRSEVTHKCIKDR